MGEELEKLFVNQKPVQIIVVLNNRFSENYPSKISEEVNSTYSHTVRLLNRMEEQGLVTSSKEGRRKMMELTDEGREVARKSSELLKALREA